MLHVHVKKQQIKPTKHCANREQVEGGNDNIMEGVNLFKIYCTHGWNYHNELPPILLMYTNYNIIKKMLHLF
jgi:hypothetical protein